jgi:hypothetical protein
MTKPREPISREEGYRRSAGKEDPALQVAREFFEVVVGLAAPTVIVEAERNRKHGDLDLGHITAECKSQPIDPEQYDRNFVEVFEDTSSLERFHHRDGLRRTADILNIDLDVMVRVSYRDARTRGQSGLRLGLGLAELGALPFVSCSLESIAGSELTIYVNPDPRRTFVYVYRRAFLLEQVRRQVLQGGLWRGKGRSNDDTFGVFVVNSPACWRREQKTWQFTGPGVEPVDIIQGLARGQVGR